ncbi:MAG: glycosyltransferase [Candidatus Micrarchaeota archaeon]
MKIAFFTDTYYPNVDGVVIAISNYRRELERRKHEVFVFSAGNGGASKQNRDPHVFFYEGIPFLPYPQYSIALNPFAAKKKVREIKPTLVHCHAMASMGFAAIKTAHDLGLPLLGTFHTLLPQGAHYVTKSPRGQEIVSQIAWRAIKEFYRPFDLVTAPTRVIVKMLAEHGVPEEKLLAVPNGVDLKKFNVRVSRAKARSALRLPKQAKVILFAGRVTEEKHVDLLPKAAKKVLHGVPEAHFVVVGDGPFKPVVEKTVDDCGVRKHFTFCGTIPNADMPSYFAAADLNVYPSTFDTYGLSIVEGMACGIPAVGADAFAIPEIVADGKNGFLFKANDADEFAEKILKALTMKPAAKKKMKAAALATAKKFSVEKATDELLAAYARVL